LQRGRCTDRSEDEPQGSGIAIAIGALLDGIPESIVIGVTMIGSTTESMGAVMAIFLSNVPEGLSSSAGMKRAGRSAAYLRHRGHRGPVRLGLLRGQLKHVHVELFDRSGLVSHVSHPLHQACPACTNHRAERFTCGPRATPRCSVDRTRVRR
jgi:hypothetical protein